MAFLMAVIQMTSGKDEKRNVGKALELVARAADLGAAIIGLPENWSHIRDNEDPAPEAVAFDAGPVKELRDVCRERRITLVAGTVPEPAPGGRVFNTCPVIGPDGGILAAYRKIHLFDVFIKDGADHQESKVVAPGEDPVTVETPVGKIGLTVCYDLRFPELYRWLALDGARMIFTPAAFTLHTGKDHWVPLLRARAIENLVYIAAPAQYGRHTQQRQSYGKSMIVDPWGVAVATAPDRECVIVAEVDFAAQDAYRKQLPCLEHVRPRFLGRKPE